MADEHFAAFYGDPAVIIQRSELAVHDFIEDERSVDEIVARGFARETVTRVQRLLYSAEYKRRQAPPGVKITRKSFGRDRRYPLTNGFRERDEGTRERGDEGTRGRGN